MSTVNNIVACHGCEYRQRPCAGECACTLTGESFIAIAKRGDCPHPEGTRHAKDGVPAAEASEAERELLAAAENPEGFGDHVASLIHKVGGDRVYHLVRMSFGLPDGCGGCNSRRQALNRLGEWAARVFTSPPK